MGTYLARIELAIDGRAITDFKSATIKELEKFKVVKLMHKTGHIEQTLRHGVDVEYVVPTVGAIDFLNVRNGTLTIIPEGGAAPIIFTGVYVTKVGAEKYDGENEVTKTIELSAEGRQG
jgi:hypothetical protein